MKNLKTDREKILNTLINKLIQVIKGMHNNQNFPFGDLMLNRQQVMILFFIADKQNGALVKELANFLQVTPGAITQFVDVLVKYKLVKRETDMNDRRSTRMILSKSAKNKFQKFKKNYFISASHAFKNFQTVELQQFIKLAEKIVLIKK